MNIWNILKIDKTKDKSLIKSAYYNILTSVNPEDNPEDFKNLRTAYEEAIKYTETNENNDIKKNTSLDLWLEKVKNIYDNFSLRMDVKKWTEITNEVERRLKYLLDKLKIERATLSKSQSLNEVMNEVSNNTAAMVS